MAMFIWWLFWEEKSYFISIKIHPDCIAPSDLRPPETSPRQPAAVCFELGLCVGSSSLPTRGPCVHVWAELGWSPCLLAGGREARMRPRHK